MKFRLILPITVFLFVVNVNAIELKTSVLKVLNSKSKLTIKNRINLARELDKAGFYHSAMAERIYVLQAARRYNRMLADEVGQASLILMNLDAVRSMASQFRSKINSFPPSLKAAVAWLNFRNGKIKSALKYLPSPEALRSINSKQARYRALLLGGTINYAAGKLATADRYFALTSGIDKNVVDPGWAPLQRARMYYEANRTSATSSQLGKIKKSSTAWYPGLMVSAWSAYRAGDYNLALGQLMTLRSPYLVNKFNPEIHILEATTLYELCYFRSAQQSLAEHVKRYQGVGSSLEKFKSQYGSSLNGIKRALKYAKNSKVDKNYRLNHWQLIMDGVLADHSIEMISKGLDHLELEQKTIKGFSTNLRNSSRSTFGRYIKFMNNAKRSYAREVQKDFSRRLKEMSRSLKESREQYLTVKLEVDFKVRDRLYDNVRPRIKKVDYDAEVKKGFEFWPWQGEFWRDELGGYYFITSDVCGRGEVR